ncbi:uncharacterized protein LOC111387002 isoform X1 [Olea europaea var. sylvestris]|uniref:uncharacterized protein LOC111387002 isoform X1 n=1 Tax=Olea europaea var. sylvestris TaxID=158386 RepID=UPI000C1D478C|nr:uncharacterized protein LOC111387002 isoform X1 [Olea europaea var. sylvestris]
MRKKNPDLKGLRTIVWMHGHLRNDGTPINEAVAATLKRIEDCFQSISDTPAENSIRDDAIARVLGPEHRGRVRGLGFGVAPSKVDGQIQSNGRVRELEEKVGALEEKVEALLQLSQQNQNKNVDDMSSCAFTQSQHESGIYRGIVHMENARCQLLYWYIFEEEEIVAEGRIASTDPSAKVHHVPIG